MYLGRAGTEKDEVQYVPAHITEGFTPIGKFEKKLNYRFKLSSGCKDIFVFKMLQSHNDFSVLYFYSLVMVQ